MAVSGASRVVVWAVAVVAGAASVGLVGTLVVNPDMADRTASVVGTVVSLASFGLAVATLVHGSGSGGGSRRVRAARGGIAAGGSVTGNAIGDRSRVVAPPTTPSAGPAGDPASDVRAGQGGIAAGGNVRDNALGDDSERR